nr:hypothetical protein [Tanacetum cinerariifolium]
MCLVLSSHLHQTKYPVQSTRKDPNKDPEEDPAEYLGVDDDDEEEEEEEEEASEEEKHLALADSTTLPPVDLFP